MSRTRRSVLEAGASTLTAATLAGCTGSTDDSSDDTESDDSDPESESNDSDPDPDPEEWTPEFFAGIHVDHDNACLHVENDDRTALEAGDSSEAGPTIEEAHNLWEVTVIGETASSPSRPRITTTTARAPSPSTPPARRQTPSREPKSVGTPSPTRPVTPSRSTSKSLPRTGALHSS